MRVVVASLFMAFAATTAHAEDIFEGLIGRQQKPLIDPAGYFAVLLPPGFDCEAAPRKVRCVSNRGVQGTVNIDVVDVPLSASVELFVLNQSDIYKKKPHFRLLHQKKMTIDGAKAILATYTYDHNGNVELAVGAQALYLVKPSKAYVIHYEGAASQMAAHTKDLQELYASFKTARLDGGGHPIIEDLKPKEVKSRDALPEVDKALKGGF